MGSAPARCMSPFRRELLSGSHHSDYAGVSTIWSKICVAVPLHCPFPLPQDVPCSSTTAHAATLPNLPSLILTLYRKPRLEQKEKKKKEIDGEGGRDCAKEFKSVIYVSFLARPNLRKLSKRALKEQSMKLS